MKVIHQICKYLNNQEKFSDEQLQYLEKANIWRLEEQYFNDEDDEIMEEIEESQKEGCCFASYVEDLENKYQPLPRKKHYRSQTNRTDLKTHELCKRLDKKISSWWKNLKILTNIAQHFSTNITPKEMPLVFRNVDLEDLYNYLLQAISSRKICWKDLWDAINFDEYKFIVDSYWDDGPVAKAYLKLIKNVGMVRKKESFLLKKWEILWIYQLIQAQRKLLKISYRIYQTDEQKVFRWINQDYHDISYWTYVILHNASNFKTQNPSSIIHPLPTQKLIYPKTLDEYTWRKAWDQALIMSSRSVKPFYTFYCKNNWIDEVGIRKLYLLLHQFLFYYQNAQDPYNILIFFLTKEIKDAEDTLQDLVVSMLSKTKEFPISLQENAKKILIEKLQHQIIERLNFNID